MLILNVSIYRISKQKHCEKSVDLAILCKIEIVDVCVCKLIPREWINRFEPNFV
jgi:hypothetical protein